MTIEWTDLTARPGFRVRISCDRCGLTRARLVTNEDVELLGKEQIADAHAANHEIILSDDRSIAVCDGCTEYAPNDIAKECDE